MQAASERMDDESKKFLQDVKKGKPRKFVMIKDGVEIDKLYIFKTGPFDRYVRSAKQEGVRGEAYWGIVRGDGFDIRFELSQGDGFTVAPGTQIRLKEFLKEETGLKFEPEYVIVETSAPIAEEELSAIASDAATPRAAAPAEDAGEKFVRLLKSILPHVKRALVTKTSISDELQLRVREAQDFGRRRDFDEGMAALRLVGQLTKQALAEADSAAHSAREKPDAGSFAERLRDAEAKRRTQWEQRVAEIEPRFQQAMGTSTADAGKLRVVMNYAQTQAARRQFMKALVGLDRLELLMSQSA
jgi:hypothetical protein